MIYYIIEATIIITFFFLLTDRIVYGLKGVEKPLVVFTVCLILTLVFKTTYGLSFWGLEYEDSYVAPFVARQYVSSILPTSFVTEGITVGSINDPIMMSEYGGHYISYPVFISLFYLIFGTNPILVDYINTSITLLICLLLCISTYKKGSLSWLVAPILYSAAPIINVFSNTHLIETYSSLIVLTFVCSALLYQNRNANNLLAAVSFLLAIITKRDNLVIAVIPFMGLFVSLLNNRKTTKLHIWNTVITLVLISITILFYRNVLLTEQTESVSIQNRTFSIQYFLKLFPVFIQSLFSIKYFTITTVLFIAIIATCAYKKELLNGYNIEIVVLFFLFLIIYCCHYRGYYFVTYGDVSHFDTFRYLNNFYILIPLFCGYNIKQFSGPFVWLSAFLLVISAFLTYEHRREFSLGERRSRLETPEAIVNHIKTQPGDCVLITDVPLIYQTITDDDFYICDISQINNVIFNERTKILCHITSLDYWSTRFNVSLNDYTIIPIRDFPNEELLVELRPKILKGHHHTEDAAL